MGAQQFGVGGARGVQRGGGGGQFGRRRTEQGLGLVGVGRGQVGGELGVVGRLVRGGEPFGLAAQPAELLAGRGRPGLQELDEGFGAGGGRLPGGPVGAVGAFEELGRAGADLVGEAVEFGQGGALVALGAGLFGAEVGSDAHLLVQLGGRPVRLAQGGQGGACGGGAGLREGLRGARDLGALGAQGTGGAVGVVRGALGGPAVLVGGACPLQARRGACLGLGCLVGQFTQPCLPAGPVAEPVGESGEGVGRTAGALGRFLPLVTDACGVGGGLVGLGARGAGLGERGFRGLRGGAGRTGGVAELGEPPGRAVGAPGADPGGEGAVGGEPGRERPDVLVARRRPGPECLALLVGGVFVVHRGVRRDEEHVVVAGAGGRGDGCEEGRGGADGHGRPGQQGGGAQDLAGAGVGVRVGDDDAVDELGPCGQDRRVVGGVHRLREVAPAGQGRDAVLAEVLDGGEDVGSRGQQSAVAEGAEDAGVVGGGGAQVEEPAFGGGDALVEEFPQLVRVVVELLGREGPLVTGRLLRRAGAVLVRTGGGATGRGTPAAVGRPSRSARRWSAAIDSAALRSAS